MEVPEPGSRRGARGTRATVAAASWRWGAQLLARPRRESDKEEDSEVAERRMEASAPVICDRNSVRLESRRRKSWWGLGPSLPRRSGGRWAAKRLRPSRAGLTPTCGSRAAAPERGLVHRRRLQPSTSRRGCCSAAAAARSPAGPEPGFPPPPRAGWLFSRGSTGLPS